jgi:hypothetical protein
MRFCRLEYYLWLQYILLYELVITIMQLLLWFIICDYFIGLAYNMGLNCIVGL